MKRILVIGIGSHDNFKDRYILSELSKLPHDIFIAKNASANYWFKEYINPTNVLSVDFSDITDCIAQISYWCETNNTYFDAIFSFKEHMVAQASIIAQAFDCIHTSLNNIFMASNNKLLFRKHYNTINSPDIIKTKLIPLASCDSLPALKSTMVIKPLFGSSSCGVQQILPGDDIASIITSSKQAVSDKFNCALNRSFLLENYINGPAFSIDGIIQNNIIHFAGINEYMYGPLPHFVQTGNIIPASISTAKTDFCKNTMRQIIRHFGFNNTPFHAEIILTKDKLYLIEIACRMPGGKIPRGYELAYGFSFVEQVVNLYLGLPVNFEHKTNFQIIQKGKHIFEDCIIDTISLPEWIDTIKDFALVTHEGEHNQYPSNNKPVYFYTVQANNLDDAYRTCNQIETSITIKTNRHLGA